MVRDMTLNFISDTGVSVYGAYPGRTKTEINKYASTRHNASANFWSAPLKYMFMKTPAEGAWTPLYCCVHPEQELVSGKYYE